MKVIGKRMQTMVYYQYSTMQNACTACTTVPKEHSNITVHLSYAAITATSWHNCYKLA